ncbi:Alpha/Beta hydrolase protein [Aspergillus lucknowensis]|uniref:Alpha/Beta hydrolase protein n=1 Tax=Aspergillus lucknowensis TaxID=176173 RepID=A0ABR4L9T3_9EURO
MATHTFTLNHPQLGGLTGRLVDHQHADGQPVVEPIVQFRSIPYATIPARFTQSVLLDHIPEHFDSRPHRDFTQYGAGCPQVPQPKGRGSARGGHVPGDVPITYDERACLNLTISVPVKTLEATSGSKTRLLPVMVYVHGGGFVEGTGHISALHDTTKMAELAAHEGMDVVIVSIGYRLNWQGFIACTDLLDESRERGEPAFNYGLRDQRTAFRWIREHIAGFGGDADNITAFGESAGAISLYIHGCTDVPLFRRVIIGSGTPSNVGTSATLDDFDTYYHRLLSYLSITEPTRRGRLHALRATPISRIIDFIRDHSVQAMKPFFGPEAAFFPPQQQLLWTTEGDILANCPWLEDIMIGDDFFEGLMLAPKLLETTSGNFIERVQGILGEEPARRVLGAYGITPGMDEGLFWQRAMVFLGDVLFSEPTHSTAGALARHSRQRRVYRWQFSLQNPFPGSPYSYGTGHHFIELLYVFMTLSARMPTHRDGFLRRQGEEMARAWVRFANGRPPLPGARPYDLPVPGRGDGGSIMVCDMLRGWTVRTRAEDEVISREDLWGERRYQGWEVLNEEIKRVGRAAAGGGEEKERIEATRDQLRMLVRWDNTGE